LTIDASRIESFYRSAVLALRALDLGRAAPRRAFAPDADLRWKGMQGHLRAADRLDLTLRNAAVPHPAAFAPRVVFALTGLADDEPFGTELTAPASLADKLLREAAEQLMATTPPAILGEVARVWSLAPQRPDVGVLERLTPATRIVATGAGAILTLAERFERRDGFDLANQVLLVTDHPGERQLFGIAAALLGVAAPVRLLGSSADEAQAREAGFDRVQLVLVSPDADPAAADCARKLAKALGA
jgi:hypothetical protein